MVPTQVDPDSETPDGFSFKRNGRATRFVWKIDAEGRFSEISREFAEAVGPHAAKVTGVAFADIAEQFKLDPEGKIVARGGTRKPYTTTVYQSTHNCGGAIMGNDPRTSAVNRYLQCWDVPNVFSIGGSAFPQNGTYNYTVTIGALTYWALDAIKNKYVKSPGPLVQA